MLNILLSKEAIEANCQRYCSGPHVTVYNLLIPKNVHILGSFMYILPVSPLTAGLFQGLQSFVGPLGQQ